MRSTYSISLENQDSKLRALLRAKGFTLIELLIVIAIIGVLVAIVVPTYQSSVRKANEAAAVTTLKLARL